VHNEILTWECVAESGRALHRVVNVPAGEHNAPRAQCIEINAQGAMTEPVISQRVLQFIGEQIDTVPQLECLVLLYQHDHRTWLTEEVAGRIYTSQ
jgi:hypothetical protein